ncbi:MAG TPA: glycoside hydrolase family 43 protein [Chloroflexia bacterium]|nr:glycoside hydrolase family 43 protein [Chloroflexia bacterium]
MSDLDSQGMGFTYTNPVYARSFPDPFVLKYQGEYWGYCTGIQPDGRCFGVLRSPDLVNWESMAGAMEPIPGNHPHYWAPEVFYDNGLFYMYYSVGDEVTMHIRVAVSSHPAGPFVDSGKELTHEQFAIDAHVFEDDDGSRYLFYATDFLDYQYIGTGTVMDRLQDPYTLAGNPQPVTRAKYDWHVYDPHRKEKGGVRWHTIEGPFVLKHKQRYYEMFSGGNWQNISYGVSYATTADLQSPDEWEQVADGKKTMPILRTIPNKVIGPGHNSVVRGPDNLQLYCVYHRWASDGSAREMAIDPQDWVGNRMLIVGPSTEPQPGPNLPAVAGFSASDWQFEGGHWSVQANIANQRLPGVSTAEAFCPVRFPYFVAEVSLFSPDNVGQFGLGLCGASTDTFKFMLLPGINQAEVGWREKFEWQTERLPLPSTFNPNVSHLLRLEVDGKRVLLELDHAVSRWEGSLDTSADRLCLFTSGGTASFAGFAMTYGWEDLFIEDTEVTTLGWSPMNDGGTTNWEVRGGELQVTAEQSTESLVKGQPAEVYDFVVNVRLLKLSDSKGGYGFYPCWRPEETGPRLHLERSENNSWLLKSGNGEIFTLPDSFDPYTYQQFRFRKQAATLHIQWETQPLGKLKLTPGATHIGLVASQSSAAFEMVRLTVLA